MEEEKIILSPYEQTAYWWTKRIKYLVRKISIRHGIFNEKEKRFADIFYQYTEKDWRNFYLELTKMIESDVKNYKSNSMEVDFSQDTEEGKHKRLNEEISQIVGRKVPDIRLADWSYKDEVIYTNSIGAFSWYKSCGVSELGKTYEPSYILTGDEETFEFYNQFLATVVALHEIDSSFDNTSLFRDEFCKDYKKTIQSHYTLKEIHDKFNKAFTKANDIGIILGRFWRDDFSSYAYPIDLVGLESYTEKSMELAKKIILKQRAKSMAQENSKSTELNNEKKIEEKHPNSEKTSGEANRDKK